MVRNAPLLGLLLISVLIACYPAKAAAPAGTDAGAGDAEARGMCPLADCHDMATIATTFRLSPATLGKHEFDLEIDGIAVSCSVTLAEVGRQVEAVCSSYQEPVYLRVVPPGEERQAPADRDKLMWELMIVGRPEAVHVTQRVGGRTLLERTTTFPHYRIFRPNGPRCAPECKLARVEWTIP